MCAGLSLSKKGALKWSCFTTFARFVQMVPNKGRNCLSSKRCLKLSLWFFWHNWTLVHCQHLKLELRVVARFMYFWSPTGDLRLKIRSQKATAFSSPLGTASESVTNSRCSSFVCYLSKAIGIVSAKTVWGTHWISAGLRKKRVRKTWDLKSKIFNCFLTKPW